ncbi:thioredoxin family protein [Legionella cardiaca]|uniref:Thioredoxin family protein n=1 Tax=Legionella cardiaca TaxID=1071983 RepID=A0ABY8AXE0_9GAMM|nr:thioredoxin family protein [Legionella cardiaca]WED44409.1 thioredoxin family protein [Legionella cardiaca]
MAKTPSNMIPLGTQARQFSLLDVVSGTKVSLNNTWNSKATVIMFICNHCPYVKHINKELAKLARDYSAKGVSFLAINSNDVEAYPDDSPENMKKTAIEQNYSFPYLYDETQEVARAYQAACTPDFYIFDANLSLVYRGQFDDSRPGNTTAVTGEHVRSALDSLLSDQPVTVEQKPSLGCNIKWKN